MPDEPTTPPTDQRVPMMRAIRVEQIGGPEVLVPADVPEPTVSDGVLLVDVDLAGVNYLDISCRGGSLPVKLPWIPGTEGVGRVREVGDGVSGFSPGDRICWMGSSGSYASVAIAPARSAFAVPSELPDEAGLGLAQGLTAHYLACETPQAARGSVALVHAAAGGVGSLLTQMLTLRGVSVVATVSSGSKVDVARAAGAEHVIVYSGDDFVEEVRDVVGSRGVDVVYDGVGRDTFPGDLRVLHRRGALVMFGQPSGYPDPIDLRSLRTVGSITIQRPMLADFIASREDLKARTDDIFEWLRNGDLRVTIGGSFPLDAAADAHRALESRATTGKLALVPAAEPSRP